MRLRARGEEDKAKRTAAILDAAAEVWSRRSWNEFTVREVAERAGVVKGTVYLYFTTKEELLLAMCARLLDDYFGEVDRTLEKKRGRWQAGHVAEAFAGSLRGRDPLLRLLPAVGGILEQNVGYGAGRDFKQRLLQHLETTAALLESHVPTLKRGEAMRFLLRMSALLTGLANMAFPAPVVEKIYLDEPRLRVLRVDVRREFADALTALLQGKEKRS